MATKLQKMKWDLHQKKYKFLLLYGLSYGVILPYDDVVREIDEDMRRRGLKK